MSDGRIEDRQQAWRTESSLRRAGMHWLLLLSPVLTRSPRSVAFNLLCSRPSAKTTFSITYTQMFVLLARFSFRSSHSYYIWCILLLPIEVLLLHFLNVAMMLKPQDNCQRPPPPGVHTLILSAILTEGRNWGLISDQQNTANEIIRHSHKYITPHMTSAFGHWSKRVSLLD